MSDIHNISHSLDQPTIDKLVTRLEKRGCDVIFSRLRDRYLARLFEAHVAKSADFLELGSGTGVVLRALAKVEGFTGRIVGVDQSEKFVEKARDLALQDGIPEGRRRK